MLSGVESFLKKHPCTYLRTSTPLTSVFLAEPFIDIGTVLCFRRRCLRFVTTSQLSDRSYDSSAVLVPGVGFIFELFLLTFSMLLSISLFMEWLITDSSNTANF